MSPKPLDQASRTARVDTSLRVTRRRWSRPANRVRSHRPRVAAPIGKSQTVGDASKHPIIPMSVLSFYGWRPIDRALALKNPLERPRHRRKAGLRDRPGPWTHIPASDVVSSAHCARERADRDRAWLEAGRRRWTAMVVACAVCWIAGVRRGSCERHAVRQSAASRLAVALAGREIEDAATFRNQNRSAGWFARICGSGATLAPIRRASREISQWSRSFLFLPKSGTRKGSALGDGEQQMLAMRAV